jgi:hypothetical protein
MNPAPLRGTLVATLLGAIIGKPLVRSLQISTEWQSLQQFYCPVSMEEVTSLGRSSPLPHRGLEQLLWNIQ